MTRIQTFAKCIRENDDLAQYIFANTDAVANGDRENPSGLTAAQVLDFMRAYAETKRSNDESIELTFGRLLISDLAMRTLHNAHVILNTLGFKGESAGALPGDTNADGVVNAGDRVPVFEDAVKRDFNKARVKRQTLYVDPNDPEEQERMRKDRSFRKVVPFVTD